MKARAALVIALLAMAPFSRVARAHADEDGAFWVAGGYVAYEVHSESAPGMPAHLLRVVRFGSARGIDSAEEVALESFQVHAMNCG